MLIRHTPLTRRRAHPAVRAALAGLATLGLAFAANVHAQAMGYAAGATGGGSRTPVAVSTPDQMRAAGPRHALAAPRIRRMAPDQHIIIRSRLAQAQIIARKLQDPAQPRLP